MNNNTKELEQELEETIGKFLEGSSIELKQTKEILDKRVTDLSTSYSNEIKTLSIISGTIAPFSLTLLGVDKLDANPNLLLCGFTFLLISIMLSQIFFQRRLRDSDEKIKDAEVELFFAKMGRDHIKLQGISTAEKLDRVSAYLDEMSTVQKKLELESDDLVWFKTRKEIHFYINLQMIFFLGGIFFIILSVVINYLISLATPQF